MTYHVRAIPWIMSLVSIATPFLACSGSDDTPGNDGIDPRCSRLCTIQEPDIDGAYDICSEPSAAFCRNECVTRLSGTTGACAQCLLDKAYFRANNEGTGASCRQQAPECGGRTTCVISGREGTCNYCGDDLALGRDCVRKVSPRRTVDCKAHYEPVSACADFCK